MTQRHDLQLLQTPVASCNLETSGHSVYMKDNGYIVRSERYWI